MNQVPLIVAWAMSIHKSQGQTLGRVKVNMGRIFEKGQGEPSQPMLNAPKLRLPFSLHSLCSNFPSHELRIAADSQFPTREVGGMRICIL